MAVLTRSFWNGTRVLVTGGAGFIGSHLVERLVKEGADVTVVGRHSDHECPENLRSVRKSVKLVHSDLSRLQNCINVCAGQQIVMNLAGKLTGIGYNACHHGDMFFSNVVPAIFMLEAARVSCVERFLVVSSACVYPRDAIVPTPEREGTRDDPEPTNFGYGWAKRVAEVQARAYRMEYGMSLSVVRPYNTYGPRDNFSWETSHVIPALIRKVNERDQIEVWGDGSQRRSFIHVRDVAKGMMLAVERECGDEPINLGSTEEIQLDDLVGLVCQLMGRAPTVVYKSDAPAGQRVRLPEMSSASRRLSFAAEVSLQEGLCETISWYKEHVGSVRLGQRDWSGGVKKSSTSQERSVLNEMIDQDDSLMAPKQTAKS